MALNKLLDACFLSYYKMKAKHVVNNSVLCAVLNIYHFNKIKLVCIFFFFKDLDGEYFTFKSVFVHRLPLHAGRVAHCGSKDFKRPSNHTLDIPAFSKSSNRNVTVVIHNLNLWTVSLVWNNGLKGLADGMMVYFKLNENLITSYLILY